MSDVVNRPRPLLAGIALVALLQVLGPAASYEATVIGATQQSDGVVEMDRARGRQVSEPVPVRRCSMSSRLR